jgi:hypothetical protein
MSLEVLPTVAKKKAGGKVADESGGQHPMIVQVRGSQEFKTWTEELAEFDSRSLASLVERSLKHYALSIGFKKDAPKR